MVKVYKIFFVLIFLFGLSAELTAQNVEALASVDSANYLVGDFINYSIEVRADEKIQVFTPFIRDSLKNFELIKELEPVSKEENGTHSTTFNYVISYYDSASVTIPAISFRYRTRGNDKEKIVLSNPVTFNVHTIAVQLEAEIKDVKEPITIPLDWKFILLVALIILILLSAAIYFYRRYKKKKLAQPVKKKIISVPAHVKALTALDILESQKLWQKGKIKEYHSDITGIIRNYFEERFKLPAPELTTSEQLQNLERVSAAKNILTETEQFLGNADLVKFAKFIPMPTVNEEMMNQAKVIVNKTIPKESVAVMEELQNV